MFFKFINETEIKPYNKGFIVFDGKIYTNPKEEQLKLVGFKPLVQSNKPEIDTATEYLSVIYKETDESIIEEYIVKKTPNDLEE